MSNFWLTLPKPIIALAPMAGYTDSAFRQLSKSYGADVVYSEMISVDALCQRNFKTINMLKHSPSEYPLVFQLFGREPNKFAQALKIISSKLSREPSKLGIDINFGCPAHKITKAGSGAALMNEIEKAHNIVKTVCQHSRFPVSIKIRTKVKNVSALNFINKIKHLPWTTIMVHGRTLDQGFSGPIDYTTIKKIKAILPHKIVLANGAVLDVKSATDTLAKTQADGLGIARGAWGAPWLFKEIKTGQTFDLGWPERQKIMLKHARLFLKDNSNLLALRKHLIHYARGLKNATHLRRQLVQLTSLNEFKNILDA